MGHFTREYIMILTMVYDPELLGLWTLSIVQNSRN
jgi:hypothetical protein